VNFKSININIENSFFIKAKKFEQFRLNCKEYLDKVNMNWDKFTMVSHDSYIGYITEYAISKHIHSIRPDIKIETWESLFDMKKIISIIERSDFSETSQLLVKNYFYDKWDLKINGIGVSLSSDVKTALTKLTPSSNWNFMYPVLQANKPGKDIMILVYYVVNDLKDLSSLKDLVLIGCCEPYKLKKCKIVKAGERTRFGTVSQIDNYITELSTDFSKLEEYLKKI